MPIDAVAQKPMALFKARDYAKSEEKCITMVFGFDLRLIGLTLISTFPELFERRNVGDGVFITFFVERKELNLSPGKPGDIDILIIPHSKGIAEFESTIAFEVKILRPNYATRGRSSNSFGISQVRGLEESGFPYAALLTIVVPARETGTPEDMFITLESCEVIDRNDRVELRGPVSVDALGIQVAERHFGRLRTHSIGETFGICVTSIDIEDIQVPLPDGQPIASSKIRGHSMPDFRRGEKNKKTNEATIQRVRDYFEKNGQKFMDYPWRSKEDVEVIEDLFEAEISAAREINILAPTVYVSRTPPFEK
jgi:hypothetical protein